MKIFWSWQSDTAGKTGRFFVRDCLLEAVRKLKDEEDLIEPSEREARDALHVDSDRQGVPGSPDLADLIFTKIDAAEVFVADVTPVSRIPARTLTDGSRIRAKRNMNPNVAIELGYALKSLGSRQVLMILNEHHGKREHLPFDLAHKAGPILYLLKDDASKPEIEQEAGRLTQALVTALRPYVREAGAALTAASPRTERSSTFAKFAYFERGTTLAEVGVRGEDPVVDYGYWDERGFYLRVISDSAPSQPFGRVDLREALSASSMPGLDRDLGGFYRANSYGGIAFDVESQAEGALSNSTQVFQNGEIWGINREFIALRGEGLVVPSVAIEQAYRNSLSSYIRFLDTKLQLSGPYKVIAGATGLAGVTLGVRSYGGSERVPFLAQSLEVTARVLTKVDQIQFLVTFFRELWDAAGLSRPEEIDGFPPERT